LSNLHVSTTFSWQVLAASHMFVLSLVLHTLYTLYSVIVLSSCQQYKRNGIAYLLSVLITAHWMYMHIICIFLHVKELSVVGLVGCKNATKVSE